MGSIISHVFITTAFGPIIWLFETIWYLLSKLDQGGCLSKIFSNLFLPILYFNYAITRFYDTTAFVHTAMWNTPYSRAAKLSYFLMLRSKVRIGSIVFLVTL